MPSPTQAAWISASPLSARKVPCRGVTKTVTVQADPLTAPVKDPWANTNVGTTLSATVDRQDFGVSWSKTLDSGGLVVGDDVRIEMELELNQQK